MAETWVRLRLLDENDNDPVFSEDVTSLVLPEDTPRSSFLASFTALDPDRVSSEVIFVFIIVFIFPVASA